jgi:CYTH domain-containing protein
MVANRNVASQAGKYARYELERRWLLESLPRDADAGSLIVDRYIEGTRLRLRRAEPPHQAFKLSRKEAPAPPDFARTVITTIYLTSEEYEVVAALPGRELRKRRHHLGRYSIDVFEGRLAGLVLAEAEFPSEEEMRAHPGPEFAVRDVSQDVRYTGGWLVANGLPG